MLLARAPRYLEGGRAGDCRPCRKTFGLKKDGALENVGPSEARLCDNPTSLCKLGYYGESGSARSSKFEY